jgi:hypothetical protein
LVKHIWSWKIMDWMSLLSAVAGSIIWIDIADSVNYF